MDAALVKGLQIMIHRRALSIRARLMILASLSAAAGIVLTCSVLLSSQIGTIRQSRQAQLRSQAEMLAFNSSAAITFQNEQAAEELLNAFRIEPVVRQAALYDAEGTLIARYDAPPAEHLGTDPRSEPIELVIPVKEGQIMVGELRLVATQSDLQAQIWNSERLSVWVAVFAVIFAALLSLLLQGKISRPISQLANLAQRMTTQEDYTLRV